MNIQILKTRELKQMLAAVAIFALVLSSIGLSSLHFAQAGPVPSQTSIEITDISPDLGEECHLVGDQITVSGSATADAPPGQLSQYHVQIDWGDGSTDDQTEASAFGVGNDQGVATRDFSGTHTYTSVGSPITITSRIYHQTVPGQDGDADDSDTVDVCVIPAEPSSITIMKDTDDDSGDSVEFDFAGDLGPFDVLGDNSDFALFSDLEEGTFSITESAETGWSYSSVTCDAGDYTQGNPVSINLAEGEDVTCTFSNTMDVVPELCEDETANNYGEEGECTYDPVPELCEDETANNYGEEGECTYDPEPDFGTLEITKYECPADTTVIRSENGVGGIVPESCSLHEGATFGYVHGEQSDASGPYPEVGAPLTAGGATNESGILTIPNLESAGRYLVVETNESNEQLPAGDILGLYCVGDGDTSDNNDNQELTFIEAGETTSCIAYNKAAEPDPTYFVDGYKWNDEYHYGEDYGYWNEGEDGLPGWEIQITDGEFTATTTTDEEGYYEFEVGEGFWTVSEVQQEGWVQTYPYEDGVCEFTFGGDSQSEGGECDFGNYENVCLVDGHKYDSELNLLSGWEMGLAFDWDGIDFISDTVETDGDGYFCINESDIEEDFLDFYFDEIGDEGALIVYEVLQEDWDPIDVEVNEEGVEYDYYYDDDNTYVYASNIYLLDEEVAHVDFYNEYTEELYPISGYMWNDVNEDGVRDEGEDPLSGWSVHATNGDIGFSTTSGSDGYYSFSVPEGTWTVSETVQNEWAQTYPEGGTYEVTVPLILITTEEGGSIFASVFDFFIPTAHAQYINQHESYDFGNVYVGCTVNCGGGGGGGGSRAPRCEVFDLEGTTLSWETSRGSSMTITANGVEIFATDDDDIVDGDTFVTDAGGNTEFELTVYRGSRSDTCTIEGSRPTPQVLGEQVSYVPPPQVLGEQVSYVPLGAADAGAGGTAPISIPTLPMIVGILTAAGAIRITRNG